MHLSKYKLLAAQYLTLRLRSGQVIPEGLSFAPKDNPFHTYQDTNTLLLKFPLLDYFGKPWNNRLTLLSFNIPETQRKKRDRLRYNLKILGFGKINRSLYITPHLTVKEVGHLVTSSGSSEGALEGVSFESPEGLSFGTKDSPFKNHIAFSVPFESFSPGFSPEGSSFAPSSRGSDPSPEGLSFETKDNPFKTNLSSFWDLTKVADLYERALAGWEMSSPSLRVSVRSNPESRSPLRQPADRDDVQAEGRFLSKFFQAFFLDPFLPAPLLPGDWIGSRALDVAKEILRI